MAAARSHEELVCWQLAHKLKLDVYELIETGPISQDTDLRDQLRRSARAAPRLMAEGFGRYVPGEFRKYLRWANGELKETMDALRHGVDSGYFSAEQIVPLQRLAKRSSKATTNLIAYLRTAKPPNEQRTQRTQRTRGTPRTKPSEPSEPPEPNEPNES
jgi:four helix bundle protein